MCMQEIGIKSFYLKYQNRALLLCFVVDKMISLSYNVLYRLVGIIYYFFLFNLHLVPHMNRRISLT